MKRLRKVYLWGKMIVLALSCWAICSCATTQEQVKTASWKQYPLEQYNVVWESASQKEADSMPTGNGDIGLNVWVEPGGDLLFYIGKTDSWSENARLLKLGRVRVKLSPNPSFD